METAAKSQTTLRTIPQNYSIKENNELALIIEGSGLEETKGQKLLAMFTPYLTRMGEIEMKINGLNKSEPKQEDIKIAREIRIALKNNRIASEKVKDDTKASILIEGRLIDNMNNIIKNTSKGLEMQCEQIEKAAEIKEAARVESLRSNRAELLSPYTHDTSVFPLGVMSADQFDALLSGYKLAKQQKEEAEAKAEVERLEKEAAEKLEQERIRQENSKLRAEAEAKEKALIAGRAETARLAKIESNKQAAILKEQWEKAAKERAYNEAKLKAAAAEADRLQKELREKQAKEKAEADRIAKELADKKAEEKRAAEAPIKEKMRIAINALALHLPDSEISADILSKHDKFKSWALQQIELL